VEITLITFAFIYHMETELREKYDKIAFLENRVSRPLVLLNCALTIFYFYALIFWFTPGNTVLYWLLVVGEVFHLWQLFTYLYTIWETEYEPDSELFFRPEVDIYVTVAGEPVDIVEETVKAVLDMEYPKFHVYILNDGFVAKKENWKDLEVLADKLGVHCITRTVPGGAKAGNINHAFRITRSPFVVIFDADHIPHSDFLKKTMKYFIDSRMGFVQSPQYYKNHELNEVTKGAWEQQVLFFGPICKGRNRLNAVTMCGTNMVIRREALEQVGGISDSIAEDFVTGMFIHDRGWKSYYVPEVLAEGLAPEDFLSYYKQQFRWARGSLDVLFRYNIFGKRGMSWHQKLQYLSSVSYFLSGFIVLMNASIPLIFFFTGLVPIQISTMTLAAIFIPYIFVTIYVLQASTNFSYSFRSLAFSMAGFNIHMSAFWAALTGRKNSFSVTSKRQLKGNFVRFVIPQMAYIGAVLVGVVYTIMRENFTPSVVTNIAWAILNVAIFSEFIQAALPQTAVKPAERPTSVRVRSIRPKPVSSS
jgi:cellulose synthase (UDP-forming)